MKIEARNVFFVVVVAAKIFRRKRSLFLLSHEPKDGRTGRAALFGAGVRNVEYHCWHGLPTHWRSESVLSSRSRFHYS